MSVERPLSILVCALGGEGGGVLSEWLVDAAASAGYAAQSTSIPGVAQRTGATTYYVEIFPRPMAELDGKRPVFSLFPVPGRLDLLVSSELLETARQVGNGMASPERTRILTSSARTLTTNERMQQADGRISADVLVAIARQHAQRLDVLDMAALARDAGTVVSAVMFGAIAGSGLLPFPRGACEDAIRDGGKGASASLAGFALAFDRVANGAAPSAPPPAATRAHDVAGIASAIAAAADASRIPDNVARGFPADVHDIVALGHARVREYQDERYAALYCERLARVLAAERQAEPAATHGYATTREAARWLALWMAFDDIVRVAELKVREARAVRVRGEVKPRDGDILRVYDHFKPGMPEFAAVLPPRLANALTRWDRRRRSRGLEPLAFPLKLGTHTISGVALLRLLAGLKGLRRRGARYAMEQAWIERWIASIERGSCDDWALGHELAQCGRLIKGYGSTNERGRDNLLHIIDHLAAATGTDARSAAERAEAVRSARSAALDDDAGKALDRTLVAHGAPARPVKAVPIRFVRKPREQAVANGD